MENVQAFLDLFPSQVSADLIKVPEALFRYGEELRLRRGHSALLISDGKEFGISGQILSHINQNILNDIINKFLNYSEYAHLDEISNGFITLSGGHRAGFCGHAVMKEGLMTYIRNVSSIVSPPGCGKTTMLRCLIRHFSNMGYTVSVCDERMEISGAGTTGFSFDLGPRTDVLTGCSKEEGMILMLRSMGPQILATDEIGSSEEVSVLKRAVSSGVSILTTIHGNDLNDMLYGPMRSLVLDRLISRIVFLTDHPRRGTVAGIWKLEQMGEMK